MKIRPVFAWYDLWLGAFWDRHNRRLYVLPLPCVGLVMDFGPRRKPTIAELEAILAEPDRKVEILPSGEVRAL